MKSKIMAELKSYPNLTSVQELADIFGVSYMTIAYRLMELLNDRKVSLIKKAGIKFFTKNEEGNENEQEEKWTEKW